VLESLLADLDQKKVIFERDHSYNETIYQATASLLMAATDSEKELSEDEVDKFINEFGFEHQETDWESAPLNSIFVGGNISVVSNQRLLQELSSLYVSFNRLKVFYRYDHDFMQAYVTPFFRDYLNEPQLIGKIERVPGTQIKYVYPPIKEITNRYQHSELLSSVKFQNLLVLRISRLMAIRNYAWLGFEEQLDGVIKLVEVELAE